MRQLYEEHLLQQQAAQINGAQQNDQMAAHLLQMQAKHLAQANGIDALKALQMLKSQQQQMQGGLPQQMMNAPSQFDGSLPNNLDIDLNGFLAQQPGGPNLAGYPGTAQAMNPVGIVDGQVDLSSQGVLASG